MRRFESDPARTRLGLAYGPSALAYLDDNPDGIDYLEIPFEQLRHAPALAAIRQRIPLVLHCASLSVAGNVPPSAATFDAVASVARQTATPWIGEHLAFIAAEDADDPAAEPTTLSYTVCPQLSEESIERVAANLATARARLGDVELIVENSPQYFDVPGSTMGMTDFVGKVAQRCDVGLLLDLTHYLITCINTGVEPRAELERWPLERVVEVHVSGLSSQSGVAWDDHAMPAPPLVFELLDTVLRRVRPRALTVEYNWSPTFPQAILAQHLSRLRGALDAA
ncbi:DUF692 domain-containing protein [Tahibacter soli]|uniref:DUF692 domain-containing protein n=1 Tax=Tahibacter soli TaxID=2983605 RepID=A0A9X3YK32_9GAMM|nr:DUF692 domain-containing protein [Tahibacter soli]MDC8012650.1 DUF692 domain-containing protein [Tahibacter soli]